MPVVLKEIRELADRAATALELGQFVMKGPQENIMYLESRVAWATVGAQLHHQGYQMVAPEEFAANYGVTVGAVLERIEKEGTLFALVHDTQDQTMMLVPLEEREEPGQPEQEPL